MNFSGEDGKAQAREQLYNPAPPPSPVFGAEGIFQGEGGAVYITKLSGHRRLCTQRTTFSRTLLKTKTNMVLKISSRGEWVVSTWVVGTFYMTNLSCVIFRYCNIQNVSSAAQVCQDFLQTAH